MASKKNANGEDTRTVMTDGGNITEIMREVGDVFDRMDRLEAQRRECNEGLSECRSKLEGLGFNKHAVKAVRSLKKLDIDLREGYDQSYGILRRAVALPVQSDLFEADTPAPPKTADEAMDAAETHLDG